jgi:hypothetical protein
MFEDLLNDTAIMTVGIVGITLLCIGGTFVFSILIYFLYARKGRKRAEDLMATGKQGQATVLSLEDTGVRINDNPRVRIGLEIRIEGYQPYRVVKTMTIPMIRMSQVQVGSEIGVLADPSEPDNPDKVGLMMR